MKNLLDKAAIIKLKEQGLSNRGVARELGIDKKTVNKYWNEYKDNLKELNETTDTAKISEIQENITSAPKYNSENRIRRKVTPEFLNALEKILEEEEKKIKTLGTNKQALTKQQIYELLKKQGFPLSYSTVVLEMKRIKSSGKECFIRQDYDFGDRLEYDFGEVKLVINGIVKRYYIAVLSSPVANFRWCYLYDNCKKDVFLDFHVRFFEMIGGVWKEIVYDNMRNVVSKFIGKNEKELNEDLVKISLYYGFDINVTNAFSGNEKGYVEGSVIYSNNELVCEHKKIDGIKKISANIRQYLKTLTFKPGALRNSYVLKSNPKLKSIFDKYYTNNPKKFIDIISKNKEKTDIELEEILITNLDNLVENNRYNNNINSLTRIQTSMYNQIMIGVVNK